jgi:hypothetical protein
MSTPMEKKYGDMLRKSVNHNISADEPTGVSKQDTPRAGEAAARKN